LDSSTIKEIGTYVMLFIAATGVGVIATRKMAATGEQRFWALMVCYMTWFMGVVSMVLAVASMFIMSLELATTPLATRLFTITLGGFVATILCLFLYSRLDQKKTSTGGTNQP
jgi:hypothetical protein